MFRPGNNCCGNEAGLVQKFIGSAYDVVKNVHDNLEEIKFIFDFMAKYDVLLCVESLEELKAVNEKSSKFVRWYVEGNGANTYTDYIYVSDDKSGVLPDNPSATGSWVKVNTFLGAGASNAIPWLYNKGSANGGEVNIHVEEDAIGVSEIFINGLRKHLGIGYTYEPVSRTIQLPSALVKGDQLVAKLIGYPALPNTPNISEFMFVNWVYNNGTSIGGETKLKPPYTFQKVPAVFINGLRKLENHDYVVGYSDYSINLTLPLKTNDIVIVQLGGETDALSIDVYTARGALRRTYAEAGLVLVDGSFEDGAKVTTKQDVVLERKTGKVYNWQGSIPGDGKVIPAGSTPASTGGMGADKWQDLSNVTYASQRELTEGKQYTLYHSFEAAVTLTQVNEAVQFSVGGIFYRWDGVFPQGGLVIPQNTPEPSPDQTGAGKYIAVLDLELRSILGQQVREAIRRSYAEAGYNLVLGSFEAGGVIRSDKDVLLSEAYGKAFSGPIGVIAPNTNPNSPGFTDVSTELLRTSVVSIKNENVSVSDFGGIYPSVSNINGAKGLTQFARLVLAGYHTGSRIGGGIFYWDKDAPKANHNGGTVIDPNKSFPSVWNATTAAEWYAPSPSGNGCWIRQVDTGYIMAEWFGAEPWVVGGQQDSTFAIQQCANVAGISGSWRFKGKHRITKTIEIPARQVFGSFGKSVPEYRGVTSQPDNFNGVNTGTMNFTNSIFYDADTGSAFKCGEAAIARGFSLYGKGLSTVGRNVHLFVPESEFYDTSAFEYPKFMEWEDVYIGFFRKAWNSKASAPYSGNYYSKHSNCVVEVVYDAFAVSDVYSYNTKVYSCTIKCKRFGNFATTARNFVVYGGSVEGYHDTTMLRESTNLSFYGTYFETFITSSMRGGAALFLFRLIGLHATISLDGCLAYLNHTEAFIRDLSGAGNTLITFKGNTWRTGSSQDVDSEVVSAPANPPYGFVGGDSVLNFGNKRLSYIPSQAAKAKLAYNAPMLYNATE